MVCRPRAPRLNDFRRIDLLAWADEPWSPDLPGLRIGGGTSRGCLIGGIDLCCRLDLGHATRSYRGGWRARCGGVPPATGVASGSLLRARSGAPLGLISNLARARPADRTVGANIRTPQSRYHLSRISFPGGRDLVVDRIGRAGASRKRASRLSFRLSGLFPRGIDAWRGHKKRPFPFAVGVSCVLMLLIGDRQWLPGWVPDGFRGHGCTGVSSVW